MQRYTRLEYKMELYDGKQTKRNKVYQWTLAETQKEAPTDMSNWLKSWPH